MLAILFEVINIETILRLESVSKIFRVGLIGGAIIKAVDNVSFTVKKGEILGLLGESGSGKSTIARLILKIIKPTKGRILYKDRDVWTISDKEYYKHVQGVFQDPFSSFNPRRQVLGLFRDVFINYSELSDKGVEELFYQQVSKVLERVGLNIDDVMNRYPHEFSGGQLQRLSIARALLVNPDLIIADEPVSMVDASTRIDILNIFIDLKEKDKTSSIIIGHDLSLINYVSDRVLVLYRGQVVEEGPVNVLTDPLHPYTKTLSEAVPRIDRKWAGPIPQTADDVDTRDSGCVFYPRCTHRMEICARREPPVVTQEDRKVKCWLYASK